MATDRNGIPLSCPVAGANRNDFTILRETLEPLGKKPATERSMCLDKGYDFAEVRLLLKELQWIPHIRTRGEEKLEKKENRGSPKRSRGGADTLMDEPLPRNADTMVQEDGELSGASVYRVYLYHCGAV